MWGLCGVFPSFLLADGEGDPDPPVTISPPDIPTITLRVPPNRERVLDRILDRTRALDFYFPVMELLDAGAVISGSFLLQCIMDEYWQNSDIDLYCPSPEIGEKVRDILTTIFTPSRTALEKIDGDYYPPLLRLPLTIYRNGRGLDLIILSNPTTPADIIKAFDMSIVKNYLDKDTLYVHSIDDIHSRTAELPMVYKIGEEGCGASYEGLLQRGDHFGSEAGCIIRMERIKKYAERGFTFKNLPKEEAVRQTWKPTKHRAA